MGEGRSSEYGIGAGSKVCVVDHDTKRRRLDCKLPTLPT